MREPEPDTWVSGLLSSVILVFVQALFAGMGFALALVDAFDFGCAADCDAPDPASGWVIGSF